VRSKIPCPVLRHEPRTTRRKRTAADYRETVPSSEPVRTQEGVPIAPVGDLVHMKLKDQMHIQDLDHAGLITLEIEHSLSAALLSRLKSSTL
jgi:hypothetical protein